MEPELIVNEQVIIELKALVRNDEAITKAGAGIRNRIQATNPDADVEKTDEINTLNNLRNRMKTRIRHRLAYFDIWNNWLINVPGIGETTAGKLILHYYFRFLPICEHCGGDLDKFKKVDKKTDKEIHEFRCRECDKKAKGGGCLKHRVEMKDFPNVSKWWAYMGRDIRNGKMRKREKGVVSNWSSNGRTLGYQIADAFTRQTDTTPYGRFLLARKEKHRNKNEQREEEWTKGRIHNAGRNEAVKLFLSHFWHVARTLEGKSTQGPWVGDIAGHSGIIPPYHWDEDFEIAA